MQASYEYILATIMIFVMLSATITTMLPLVDINLSEAREYQLELIADRVLNKILRTTGYPPDWGSDLTINWENTSNLKDFGLALAGARGAYVLDPNKVTKIENSSGVDNPYYVQPRVAAELLGLGNEYGSFEYGFALSILPALNITVTSISKNMVYLDMTTQENIPAPNANVSAIALWWKGNKMLNATSNATTDWQGKCALNFTEDLEKKWKKEEGAALIVLVDFHGVKTVDFPAVSQSLMASVTDRYVTVVFNETGTWYITGQPLLVVYPYVFVGKIVNGTKAGGAKWLLQKGKKTYSTFELAWIDPYTNYIVLVAEYKGSHRLVIVPRPLRIQYQTGPLGGMRRVTIHRLAVINGITHYVRFSIWRMSE